MDEDHTIGNGRPRRWVLDTNVWLDLLLFDDPRCRSLNAALEAGDAIALTDAACGAEWRRVLLYPALRLDPAAAHALQRRFDLLATILDPADAARVAHLPRCRDTDDQKFLELAAASGADLLISRDDALLRLGARTQRQGLFRICRPDDLGAHCPASP